MDRDRVSPSFILLGKSPTLSLDRMSDCEQILIRKRMRATPLVVARIAAHCRSHAIDVLHTHSVTGNFYGRMAGRLLPKTAILTTVHAKTIDELTGSTRVKMKAHAVYRTDLMMHRLSDRLIVPSEFLRTHLLGQGVPDSKIHVIPHGIRHDAMDVAASDVEAIRQRYKLSPANKVVGIVGRLAQVKNHEMFLRAAKQVADAVPDSRFMIVGDGPLRDSLERMAAELGIADRMIWTGWISDVPACMQLLDVLVISSISEGFGYNVLEGMAAARAVVATRVSEIPRLIDDGDSGLLVDLDDVQSLARSVTELLQHDEKRAAIGTQAKRAVADKFPLQQEGTQTLQVYEELANERRTRMRAN